MLERALKIIFGSKHERDIKKMVPAVAEINDLEAEMKKLSDEELGELTPKFKARLADGETLDDILPEAFAAVREAAWRTLGMRHFDVQMIGGIILHQGKIAEMKTGEGKTLTSTGPIYLNALSGKGVHVVTVNDYLARRDANWMKPVYDLLKVKVAWIQHDMDYADRQAAYAADITYGTNNEFGFDFLRDNMVTESEHRVQRSHNYAIVDEVDSILIDEARTPLIISGPAEENTEKYEELDRAVRKLVEAAKSAPPPPEKEVEPGKEEPHVVRGYYYDIDEKARNSLLTEEGVQKMEELLGVDNLFAPENVDLVAHTNQALRAHLIYEDDVDYIVRDGEVIIIDEHTGRTMEGRRYSDGLHQAIEAKERVEIKRETQTLASITFQNYFRLYTKLAGMTGTADTEAEEFNKIYKLECVVVPTNVPIARIDAPDRVYRTEQEKWEAIVNDIREGMERKQPALVGTISVEKSEYLSGLLRKAGIDHNVLNAKHHQREAEIVEQAGKPGAVTVATNMAGRGTDIVLGGAPLWLKDLEEIEETEPAVTNFKDVLRKRQFDAGKAALDKIKSSSKRTRAQEVLDRSRIWLKSHEEVKAAGGLHILGTERHESRRIDNQLRGRSGRQGDPGSSRFYLSLEDNLMRIFGGDRIKNIMGRLGMEHGQELEARMVDRAIARAQKRVETHNFDIRKHLLEYDDVMNRQREFIYEERNYILDNEIIQDKLFGWGEELIESQVLTHCEAKDPGRWEKEGLYEFTRALGLDFSIDNDTYIKSANPQLDLFNAIWDACKAEIARKQREAGDENWYYLERRIALDVIDARWKEHLYTMDHLREGIWSISYAEKNPLVEYKLQGFRLFDEMVAGLKEQVVEFLMRVQVEEGPIEMEPPKRTQGTARHDELQTFASGGPGSAGGQPPFSNKPGTGPSEGGGQSGASSSGGGSSKRKKKSRRRRK